MTGRGTSDEFVQRSDVLFLLARQVSSTELQSTEYIRLKRRESVLSDREANNLRISELAAYIDDLTNGRVRREAVFCI